MINKATLATIVVAFLAGTIIPSALSHAYGASNDPLNSIAVAINNLSTVIQNKQTTVTVNAPQGPAGPTGPTGATGPQGPAGPAGTTVSFYVVTASGSINPGLAGEADAYCNTGDVATGGGFGLTITGAVMSHSGPIVPFPGSPPSGWIAQAINNNNSPVPIDSWVVCAKTH